MIFTSLSVSPQIVIEYLTHPEAAFLIHRCPSYDIQSRKLFEIGERICFEYLGLRDFLLTAYPSKMFLHELDRYILLSFVALFPSTPDSSRHPA
jgi:predicted AAA+ superfamily ATPase